MSLTAMAIDIPRGCLAQPPARAPALHRHMFPRIDLTTPRFASYLLHPVNRTAKKTPRFRDVYAAPPVHGRRRRGFKLPDAGVEICCLSAGFSRSANIGQTGRSMPVKPSISV